MSLWKNIVKLLAWQLILVPTLFAQSIKNPDEMPSFAVGPMEIKLPVRPGQTVKSSFILATRKYSSPQNFLINRMDLGQETATSTVPVEIGKGTKSCAEWITIANEIRANPNDRVEIPFTINVPRKVTGHYFAYIDVSTKPDRPAGIPFAVLVKYRLPVRIELTIPGAALLRVNAKELSYNPGTSKEAPSVTFNVANEGEWKTTLTGEVVIRGIGTGYQQVLSIPYSPTTGKAITVYPGIELPIRCELAKALKPGDYTTTVIMLLNQFGKTQANFEFSVGKNKTSLAKVITKEEYDLDVTVSPHIIEMPLSKGAVRNIPIRVKNNNKIPINLNVSLQKATMQINGSFIYQNSNSTDSTNNWIEISPHSLMVDSIASGAIKVKMAVPENYKSAFESIYVIRFEAKRSGEDKLIDGEWKSKGEYSVPVMVYEALAKPAQLECSKFDIIQQSKDLNPTAGIMRVKNVGGKLAKVQGIIRLKNKDGKEYAYMDIGKFQPEMIMPGGEREFRFEIPTLDEGEFMLLAELGLEGQKEKLALNEQRSFIAVAKRPEGL